MLGVGISELILLIVLFIVLLKPRDLRMLIKQIYQMIDTIGDYFRYVRHYFREEIADGKINDKLTFKQFKNNHYSQQTKKLEK